MSKYRLLSLASLAALLAVPASRSSAEPAKQPLIEYDIIERMDPQDRTSYDVVPSVDVGRWLKRVKERRRVKIEQWEKLSPEERKGKKPPKANPKVVKKGLKGKKSAKEAAEELLRGVPEEGRGVVSIPDTKEGEVGGEMK